MATKTSRYTTEILYFERQSEKDGFVIFIEHTVKQF